MKNFVNRKVARSLRKWITSANENEVPRRFDFAKRLRQWPTELAYEDGLFRVAQGDLAVHIARKARVHMFMYDLEGRLADLRNQYLVPEDMIRDGDVVIDCGANIGEFSIISARNGAQVYAFEPDPIEFNALKRNAETRSITVENCALWNENGELDFFDANDDGDSSLFDQGNSTSSYRVKTMRLDDFPELPSGRIRLIKLEAEGAEPEIIEGMPETLARTEYVTVDMGPERGVSHEPTLVPVTNALYDLGFRIERFATLRCLGVFANQNLLGD